MSGEPYYVIRHVDRMPPFFISLVSHSDHWFFASSTGGLTAGRVSPETALFPYVPVDRIHESALTTGCKTVVKVDSSDTKHIWQPFNTEQNDRYSVSRHLYKHVLGHKICFEEVNHDLHLTFRYSWSFSESYGFCRHCELLNLSEEPKSLTFLDGLQNVLPAGTPRFTQTQSSNLVDAYKWSELDPDTGLACFTLYSAITDRAEPSESLRANTLFYLGLDDAKVLLSSEQVSHFIEGRSVTQENLKRGVRGAYLVTVECMVEGKGHKTWDIVANVEQTQPKVVSLRNRLANKIKLGQTIEQSIEQCGDELARIMGASDGFQVTDELSVSTHHYANTLFNVLRGGIFNDQYRITKSDFIQTIKLFNNAVYERHLTVLEQLSEVNHLQDLILLSQQQNDNQFERLVFEYLPITFGRRHGDPSRPWNQFELRFKDERGNRLLSYQGNWRDIFQNWEALLFSYPSFIEQVIAKFVNASTVDGYNPYRITKQGIDWEVEEPDDPWSYIGYWGDHQIIYLLKLLELSEQFHPGKLHALLSREIFSFANVPYKIKPFADIIENAKETVVYDEALATEIEERVSRLGNDGKLLLDKKESVYQVNLLEKLLVSMLCKLGNFVMGGGIWLNTQRPEWNDANNALVGQGVSMVTLYYMRRYIAFMQRLLKPVSKDNIHISAEVAEWLTKTLSVLKAVNYASSPSVSVGIARQLTRALGEASSDYRMNVYEQGGFSGKIAVHTSVVIELLDNASGLIDLSIQMNLRKDGLYHAYNLLSIDETSVNLSHLYPMLEGQVAVLSSGALSSKEACDVLDALFESTIYRKDQNTFMLYPDRELPSFLDKNRVANDLIEQDPLLSTMVRLDDERIVSKDEDGWYRFHSDLKNVGDLNRTLDDISAEYGEIATSTRQGVCLIYEKVFKHKAFTGRSGGMFGFEGLGCIYWHMVAKLLLAVQEQFFAAHNEQVGASLVQRLGEHYYAIREGIGFNKTPEEYGAFPCDPYSHTPKHAGAQQPGMTGQVKEEVLTRFGELGIQVKGGLVVINPQLLRVQEFCSNVTVFKYLDVNNQWQFIDIRPDSLAFTWCQVPFIYTLTNKDDLDIVIVKLDGQRETLSGHMMTKELSQMLFGRTGGIEKVYVNIPSQSLFVSSV